MSRIPRPIRLLTPESRSGFYALIAAIHEADTNRELTLFVQQYVSASREYRALFDNIEGEILEKMRQFLDEDQPERSEV